MRRALAMWLAATMLVVGSAGDAGSVVGCDPGSWDVISSLNIAPTHHDLRDVRMASRRHVWAVGSVMDADLGSTVPLVQHWDGSAWTTAQAVPDGMVGSLAAVDASASGDVWAVGSKLAPSGASRAVATHWDGVTWESVRPAAPLPGRYVSTVFADVLTFGPDEAWAVGYWSPVPDAPPSPLVERWNGRAWRVVKTPGLGTWSELHSIAGSSPRDVWAAGNTEVQIGSSLLVERPLMEHWNGTAWKVVPVPILRERAPGTFESVDVRGPDDAWAVGELTMRRGVMTFSMRWNGARWNAVRTVNPSEEFQLLADVRAIAPRRVWAVGSWFDPVLGTDRTLVQRWDGERWVLEPSADGEAASTLAGVDASRFRQIAVGGYWANGGDGPQQTLVLTRC